MPIINYGTREVEFKIVFYGPAFAGKTTNLKYIHSRLHNAQIDKLVTLKTGADRTLFFDFVPENADLIEGFLTRFQLYTVPGAVVLNVPRQLVLRDVDGIVFVADSQWDRLEENVASMANLEENIRRHQHSLNDIPLVFQYNKRDLSNVAPLGYLEFLLNNRDKARPSFESVASEGRNVFASLNSISEQVVDEFRRQRPQEKPGHQMGVVSGEEPGTTGLP